MIKFEKFYQIRLVGKTSVEMDIIIVSVKCDIY